MTIKKNYIFKLFKVINLEKFLKYNILKISFYGCLHTIAELLIILIIIPFIYQFIDQSSYNPLYLFIFDFFQIKEENYLNFQLNISVILLILIFIILIFLEKRIIKICFLFFSRTKKNALNVIIYQNLQKLFNKNISIYNQIIANELNISTQSALAFYSLIRACSLFLIFSGILLFMNFKLTVWIIISLILINLLVFKFFKKKFSLYGKLDLKQALKANSIIYNIIINLFSVRQYSLEYKVEDNAFRAFKDVENIRSEYLFNTKLIKYFLELIIFSLVLLFLYFVINYKNLFFDNIGFISIGAYAIFRLFPIINQFNSHVAQIVKFETAAKEILKTLSIIKNKKKQHFSKNLKNDVNKIEIKNYSLKVEDRYLIKNSNLRLNKKILYFLTGANGSGKSTFCQSLLKVKKYQGKIKFDNLNLQKISDYNLFKILKFCPQNDLIFNDTTVFNITFKNNLNELEQNKLNKIINLTRLNEFAKDKNIFTEKLGEHGSKLSGGEMQKILISRSLFFDPKILIMDEVFSNISSKDTELICKDLQQFYSDMLIIIISHKIPKTVKYKEIEIKDKKIKLI